MNETTETATKPGGLRRFITPENRLTWIATALLLIVATAWVYFTPAGILGKADAVGYAVCHRITIRSFLFPDGRQLPLCARCSGTFLGVLVGLFVPGLLLGRKRAGNFPSLALILILLAFSALWAFDGANSYGFLLSFQGMKNIPHLYTPSNPLRLMTGMGQGITMGSLLLPVANAMLWDDAKPDRTLDNIWHLLALVGVGAVLCVMLLSGIDIFIYILAILSALGVVIIMSLIFTVVITNLLHRENKSHTLVDALPLLMFGLTGSLLLIGMIDLLRFMATGTWDGFINPPV
jgi:uncharacterized membrane protein